MSAFDQANAQVFGISVDPVSTLRAFAQKESLRFPLLSDSQKKVSRAYGVLDESGGLARRTTLVVDKQGIIRRIDSGINAMSLSTVKSTCVNLK